MTSSSSSRTTGRLHQILLPNTPHAKPSRTAVLSTYRRLLRSCDALSQGRGQLHSKARGAQWQRLDAGDERARVQPALAAFRVNGEWRRLLRDAYRQRQHESDARAAAEAQVTANELSLSWAANLQHSREIYEAGWGLMQDSKAQIANVARTVGLELTPSKLDVELGKQQNKAAEGSLLDEAVVDAKVKGYRESTATKPASTPTSR